VKIGPVDLSGSSPLHDCEHTFGSRNQKGLEGLRLLTSLLCDTNRSVNDGFKRHLQVFNIAAVTSCAAPTIKSK